MTLRTIVDDAGPIARTVAQKFCPKCQTWKATRHFHKDRHRPDGLYAMCRSCRRPIQAASQRRWRARNAEDVRQYREDNRQQARADDRRRYHADVEASRARSRETMRRYRAKNREVVNATKRAAYAANAEMERAAARLRREKKRATKGATH